MPSEAGSINKYTCSRCLKTIVTELVDSGTTPFMIPCTDHECDGEMRSHFFQVCQHLEAEFEWYSPDNFTMDDLESECSEELGYSDEQRQMLLADEQEKSDLYRAIKDHIDAGGLLIRKKNTKKEHEL